MKRERHNILHCQKSILYTNERNAYEEVEWLKMQLAVNEEELKLMIMEKKCKDVIF